MQAAISPAGFLRRMHSALSLAKSFMAQNPKNKGAYLFSLYHIIKIKPKRHMLFIKSKTDVRLKNLLLIFSVANAPQNQNRKFNS